MNLGQFDKGAVMGVGLVVGSAFMTLLLCGKFRRPWVAVKWWIKDLFRPDDVKLGGKRYPLDNGQVKVGGISIPLILAKAWAKVRPLEDFLPWAPEVTSVAGMGGAEYPWVEPLPDDHYRFTEGQWNGLRARVAGARSVFAIDEGQVAPPGVMCICGNWLVLGQYADGSILVESKGDRESAFKKIERVYNQMVAQQLWEVHHAGGLTRGVAGVAMQSSVVSGSTGEVSLGTLPPIGDDLARQMGVAGMIPAGAAAGLAGSDWEAEAARLSNERVVAMRSGQPVITAQQGESSSLMLCQQWNERYPIGTRVAINTRLYRVRREGVTLTPAYVMSDGSPAMVYVTEVGNAQVGCPIPLRDLRALSDIAREMRDSEGRERAAALATPANPSVSVNMVADSQGLSQNLRRNRDGRSAIPGLGVMPDPDFQARARAQAEEDQAVFAAIDAAGNHPVASDDDLGIFEERHAEELPRVATPEELCVYWNRNHPVGSAVTYGPSDRGNYIDGTVMEPASPIPINGEGNVPAVRVMIAGTLAEQVIRLSLIRDQSLNAGALTPEALARAEEGLRQENQSALNAGTQARPHVGTIEVQGISDRYTDSVTEWAWQYVVGGREISSGGMTREFAPTPNEVKKVALKQLVESGRLLYEEPVDSLVGHPLNASVEDARLRGEFLDMVDDVQSVVG